MSRRTRCRSDCASKQRRWDEILLAGLVVVGVGFSFSCRASGGGEVCGDVASGVRRRRRLASMLQLSIHDEESLVVDASGVHLDHPQVEHRVSAEWLRTVQAFRRISGTEWCGFRGGGVAGLRRSGGVGPVEARRQLQHSAGWTATVVCFLGISEHHGHAASGAGSVRGSDDRRGARREAADSGGARIFRCPMRQEWRSRCPSSIATLRRPQPSPGAIRPSWLDRRDARPDVVARSCAAEPFRTWR